MQLASAPRLGHTATSLPRCEGGFFLLEAKQDFFLPAQGRWLLNDLQGRNSIEEKYPFLIPFSFSPHTELLP